MPPETSLNARHATLAVVPAYNEAATVDKVGPGIKRPTSRVDVLVVDEGSTDGTGRLAEAAGARVLRLPFNLGIGGAVQAGFRYAYENGYRFMVQVDGDGQHDPGEIQTPFEAMASEAAPG